jgi:hypothetical protein
MGQSQVTIGTLVQFFVFNACDTFRHIYMSH